ncbi:DUF1853 family protein [Cupriavidus pinatubonensis]|uniref:DUF1853 domain-containing protein n=1 Tax=Cupriavidus pinatubonensis TaxID=248026 RepID=A0ABM8WI00_9BURK|nr:DUF1853 family protein [Cupriavidus pinatubonensis]CAG9167029.1 hypothetical protein LMG23994_01077 [Cupriavidus pinatubonensis]
MREPRPDLPISHGGNGVHTPALPLWRQAASQRARDLAWCTLSPPLLETLPGTANGDARPARWPAGTQAAWERWLEQADPAGLPATIGELANGIADALPEEPGRARSLRLGRHAERLLHFALRQAQGLELIAANVPVRRAHGHGIQTLGELDFVWRDLGSGEVVHWEMATKFYLMVDAGGTPPQGLRAFVGPNLVDRLGDKLDHIVHRQLPLARTAEAQALLGPAVDRSEVYLLGWLFYRDGQLPDGLDALGIAHNHLHGWWSTLDDWFARASSAPGTRWCRLPRPGWLSGAWLEERDTEGAATLREALAQRFADPDHGHSWRRESPVMLCELEPAGAQAPGWWRERSRGFVVPPGWEARARVRAAEPVEANP